MTAIRARSFDHVALWVGARDELAAFCRAHLGMHEIERTDEFTLLGVDAREGKLTLFDADGPRQPAPLELIALRVGDLDAALAALPGELDVERADSVASFAAPAGVRLGLVAGGGLDYDLDHVLLRVPDPEQTLATLAELGFERRNGALEVADRSVRIEGGGDAGGERPLLNHLALLVDSMAATKAEAERRGLEIDRVVDAENTLAVFVRGPDGIVVEFVEHKPGFALV